MDIIKLFYIGIFLNLITLLITIFTYIIYSLRLKKLSLSTKFDDLEQRILNLENEKEVLNEEVKLEKELKKKLIDDHQEFLDQVERAKKWMEDNNTNMDELRKIDEKLKLIQDQLLEKQGDLSKIKNEILSVEEEKLKLKNIENKIKEYEEGLKKLEEAHRAGKEMLDGLNIDIKQALKNKEDLTNEIKMFREKINNLEKELQQQYDLENSIRSLKSHEQSLKDTIKREQQSQDEIIKRSEQIRNDFKPPNLDIRLEDLNRPYLAIDDNIKPIRLKSEQDALASFKATLDKSNFIFHDRTIKSFHTSLKISDISPLSILAGISGTGKTLLPQLYSQFMGIHFLPISVQPRWDSPNDLFGFYNYMEHRFKATELSRVLWQLDKYNNPAKSSKNAKIIQDSLVLVLLDEMNLARVEYYFSDLLSKLEIRRNIDFEDSEKRKNAEIMIESGSLRKNEKSKSLTIMPNILFAGTMNEDETTQILSDKVIDRGNVLRFGKPSYQLTNKPNKELFDKKCQNGYMSIKLWDSWKVGEDKYDEDHIISIRKYLDDINNALAKIGKPFGNRTQLAVESYVMNYPKEKSNYYKKAFADQIELKLLPKLVGIDKNDDGVEDVYTIITDIISDLEDTELQSSFEQAKDALFFSWNGVNRTINED